MKEPLQGQFLSEVFDRLLGYRQIVGGDGLHPMEPETSSKSVKGYNPPDARLGWFAENLDRNRAAVELKAPGADLDAKQGTNYGKLTPVEQAFGYAATVDGCPWVVMSNFVEIRLYRTERGQGYCQRFELAGLADPDRLAAIVFPLGRATLLDADPAAASVPPCLANHTHVEQERIKRRCMCVLTGPATRPVQPASRTQPSQQHRTGGGARSPPAETGSKAPRPPPVHLFLRRHRPAASQDANPSSQPPKEYSALSVGY